MVKVLQLLVSVLEIIGSWLGICDWIGTGVQVLKTSLKHAVAVSVKLSLL